MDCSTSFSTYLFGTGLVLFLHNLSKWFVHPYLLQFFQMLGICEACELFQSIGNFARACFCCQNSGIFFLPYQLSIFFVVFSTAFYTHCAWLSWPNLTPVHLLFHCYVSLKFII